MNTVTSSRVAAALGLANFVLVAINIIGFGGGNPPDPHASAEQIRATYAAGHVGYMMGPFLDGLGSTLLIGFFYVLARRAEPERGVLSTLVVAGAVLASALDLLWAGCLGTAVQLALINANAESVKAMVYLSVGILWIIAVPLAVAYLAVGIASVRAKSLPIWFGWSAIVIGALALIGHVAASVGSANSPITFVGYIFSLVWVVAVSIYLLARPTGPAALGQ